MCSTNTGTYDAYRRFLPPEEPCFTYRLRPAQDGMPDPDDAEDEGESLFQDAVMEAAFPDEFEWKTVWFLLAACTHDKDLRERDDAFAWTACSWGFLDRLVGTWWINEGLWRKWVLLKRVFGRGRATAAERQIRSHALWFTRDTAFFGIRSALDRLIAAGVVAREIVDTESDGDLAFYRLTPAFLRRLRAVQERTETSR